jgi:hypothetical protein
LRNRRKVWVSHKNQLGPAARRSHCRCHQSHLATLAAREYKFALSHGHAVQFWRVVKAEQAAFHSVARGKFREDRRHLAAGTLHPSGRVQLREQSDEHAPSLPTAARERKTAIL